MPDPSQNVPLEDMDATTYAAIVDDDPQAWTRVIQHTRRYLIRVLTTQGAAWDDAEEFVQLTYAKAWERRAQFARGQDFAAAAFRGWLTSIAVNAWRDQLRRQKNPRVTLINHCDLGLAHALAYGEAPAPEPTAEDLTVRAEELAEAAATIVRLTGRLSPQARARVHLLLDAHSGYAQRSGAPRVSMRRVMAVTGLSHTAAKSAMHRVRIALRDAALEERLEATS